MIANNQQSGMQKNHHTKVFLACGAYIQHILFGNKYKLQQENKHFNKSVTLLSSSDKSYASTEPTYQVKIQKLGWTYKMKA